MSSSAGPSRKSERLQQKPVAMRSQQPLAKRTVKRNTVTSPTSTFPILATMSDSSSLASVVRVNFRKKWQKLADGYSLALFHARFWGKSMKDEEEEWRKAQPHIEGQPEDEDESRYEGKGKGRMIDEDEDEAMDEDELEGEATDEDEDAIPGCYPFIVGIEGMTVWIRADYIRIFEALQDFYEKAAKQSGRTPSAVVTGQPGIGKSRYFASSA